MAVDRELYQEDELSTFDNLGPLHEALEESRSVSTQTAQSAIPLPQRATQTESNTSIAQSTHAFANRMQSENYLTPAVTIIENQPCVSTDHTHSSK